MKVMVVDDSRAIRKLLGKILVNAGFEVFEAGHGKEALEKLLEVGMIDLALVDWNMPEMNGYEFVQAVRREPKYNSIRLVMVTTESEASQMIKAMEAGANEYIMKPFTPEILSEKLALLGFKV